MNAPWFYSLIVIACVGGWAAGIVDAVEVQPQLDNKITQGLQTKLTVSFDETPLTEALQHLATAAKVPHLLDHAALQDEGIDPSTPVNLHCEQRPIAQILLHILRPLQLRSVVTSNWFKVTTMAAADEILETRVYDVSKIIETLAAHPMKGRIPVTSGYPIGHAQFGGGMFVTNLRSRIPLQNEWSHSNPEAILMEAIQECTHAQWNQIDGVGGSMLYVDHQLVIRQPNHTHRDIFALLVAIESMLIDPQHPVQFLVGFSAEELQQRMKYDQILDTVTKYPAGEVAMADWITAYLKDAGVPIDVDTAGLQDEGIDWSPTTVNVLPGVSRRDILQEALRTIQSTLVYVDGRYVITTVAKADEEISAVVYDISRIPRSNDEAWVTQLLQESTSGQWENVDGVGGTVSILGSTGLIAAYQTERVHRELAALFEQLRQPATIAEKPSEPARTFSVYGLPNAEIATEVMMVLPKLVDMKVDWPQDSIQRIGSTLIVHQSEAVHERLDLIIDGLRSGLLNQDRRVPPPDVPQK